MVGEVSNVDWSVTSDGTSVSAWIGNIELAHTQISGGSYSFQVPTCRDEREFNTDGAIVKFRIGGYWAEQSLTLLAGGMEVLNLHQTNDPVVIN